jgi:hypothetical protein
MVRYANVCKGDGLSAPRCFFDGLLCKLPHAGVAGEWGSCTQATDSHTPTSPQTRHTSASSPNRVKKCQRLHPVNATTLRGRTRRFWEGNAECVTDQRKGVVAACSPSITGLILAVRAKENKRRCPRRDGRSRRRCEFQVSRPARASTATRIVWQGRRRWSTFWNLSAEFSSPHDRRWRADCGRLTPRTLSEALFPRSVLAAFAAGRSPCTTTGPGPDQRAHGHSLVFYEDPPFCGSATDGLP